MVGKIFISAIIVVLFIWAIIMTFTTIWLFRNFSEYMEISKHNDDVFKEVISAHSAEIGEIKETIKNDSLLSDKIIKDIDKRINKQSIITETLKNSVDSNTILIAEYQHQLSTIDNKIKDNTLGITTLQTILNVLQNHNN